MSHAFPMPFLFAVAAVLPAQSQHQWVVPARSVLAPAGCEAVRLVAAAAHVRIADRTATTTLEVELHNPGARDQEAVLLLPVPDGAAVSQFTFEGPASEPSARILPRDEARRLYAEITASLRDPALLEFAGWNCLRSSVFPVPRGGRQKLRLVYDHVLEVDGERIDYVLPRSEMLTNYVPWSITVDLQARADIGLCYSPSHDVQTTRRGPRAMTLRVTERARRDPGAFRLCYTAASDPDAPTAVMFAYPDPTIGGGYFLLLANAPPANGAPMRREVTLVLDRSGSMAGKKLEQAKAAALQVLEGLADGEGMQLLDYGNDVARAFAQPVPKDAATLAAARAYLDAIRPHGGTNIHDALLEALRAPVMPGTLPLVLFLTDGVPTVGPTGERELNSLVAAGNAHSRRVFCFGVGNDVNVPLLDRIAETTRAMTTYVLPDEDVEVKVARTFARLGHPVLAGPRLRLKDDATAAGRLRCLVPHVLPDLFTGDQLVLLGQYRDDQQLGDELQWRLTGDGPGGKREFDFTLSLRSASTAHAFVARLWASRQIAFLVDELRQQAAAAGARVDAFADPRHRELRDEILRLSARFGVLGEYTAFLATEGSRLDDWNELASACADVLTGRALATRTGAGAVNQGCNLWAQKQQVVANPRNAYLDHELKAVEVGSIQQLCDRAFLRQGNRWIDGNAVVGKRVALHECDERVEFGSARYFELARQLESDRRSGVLSLPGEILLDVQGKTVLITMPGPAVATGETTISPKESAR